jgi:hypothetical protein
VMRRARIVAMRFAYCRLRGLRSARNSEARPAQ